MPGFEAYINLNTLEDFFAYNSTDRNLEIYLKNPQNIEFQKNIVQKMLSYLVVRPLVGLFL